MREQIASYVSRAATKERLKDRGVDPKVYEAARLRVDLEPHEAKEVESGESGKNVGMNLAISGVVLLPHLHVDLHLRRLHHARRPRGEEQPHRRGHRLVGQADDAHAREDPRDRPRRPHAVRRLGVPRARDRAARASRPSIGHGRGAAPHPGRDDRRVRPLLPARVLPLRLALRRALGPVQHGAGGAAVRDDPRHDAHPHVHDVVLRVQPAERHARDGALVLPVHGAAHDVHAHLRADAAALADRDVRRAPRRDDRRRRVVRGARSTAWASSCTARSPRCPRSSAGRCRRTEAACRRKRSARAFRARARGSIPEEDSRRGPERAWASPRASGPGPSGDRPGPTSWRRRPSGSPRRRSGARRPRFAPRPRHLRRFAR